MKITKILKINILVLRININDNNKYEFISYFGDVNINNYIRSLCILEIDETSNHFQCQYYNLNSNIDLDNYTDIDENNNILEEKKNRKIMIIWAFMIIIKVKWSSKIKKNIIFEKEKSKIANSELEYININETKKVFIQKVAKINIKSDRNTYKYNKNNNIKK